MYREIHFYEKYIKRIFDIICALLAIIVFCWLYLIIAILVRINIGSPIIFRQARPGKIDRKTNKEKIFYLYKFRTMSNEKDEKGNLLPDNKRLGKFGKMLRSTSLDELPEAFNILKGDMSVIGPRPQLIKDMVFMSEGQRMRHTARPGLSGLAQVKGRNAISWEDKINWDLKYIENVTFINDVKIILLTVKQVFIKKKDNNEIDVTDDYGDALLKEGKISKEKYDNKQEEAKNVLDKFEGKQGN